MQWFEKSLSDSVHRTYAHNQNLELRDSSLFILNRSYSTPTTRTAAFFLAFFDVKTNERTLNWRLKFLRLSLQTATSSFLAKSELTFETTFKFIQLIWR